MLHLIRNVKNYFTELPLCSKCGMRANHETRVKQVNLLVSYCDKVSTTVVLKTTTT